MCENDIFQPLTRDDDLIKLRDLYKHTQPASSHVYNYLSNVIRRRTLEPKSKYFTIYTPNGKFDNGTLVGIEKGIAFMYTLEEGCEALQEALRQTNRFDWTQDWIIYSIAKEHLRKVLPILRQKGLECLEPERCGIWWMSKQKAASLTIGCPKEVYLAPIELKHVDQIHRLWPVRFPGSQQYLDDIITYGGGYGVFFKSNCSLVAWALHNPIGIGNIQTVSEHMRKGYATLVARYVSRKIGESGCDPVATVGANNIGSKIVFSKAGFEYVGDVFYVFSKDLIQPKSDE